MNIWITVILICNCLFSFTDSNVLSKDEKIETVYKLDSNFIKKFNLLKLPFYDTSTYEKKVPTITSAEFGFLKNGVDKIKNLEQECTLDAVGRFIMPQNANYPIFLIDKESKSLGLFTEENMISVSKEGDLLDILTLGKDDSNNSYRFKVDSEGLIHLINLKLISSSNKFEKDGSIKVYSEIKKKVFYMDEKGKFIEKESFSPYNDTLIGDRGRYLIKF